MTGNLQDVIIRKASVPDIDSLVELLEELFSIEEDFVFDEQKQRAGLLLMLEAQDERCVMVAELNKKVVGMCSVQAVISTAEGCLAGVIEDMIVSKKYRGKGIGKSLLELMEAWSKEKGIARLQLLTDKNNAAALEFYKRTGWVNTQLICLRKFFSQNVR
ncbi:MAG: GNAT family N-acetyltransferase [Candidatus Omnitrophica bacterium]|nr:GNAT family N-acetyltransferase [Candidatus Omnitrophota bacterium]